MKTLLFICLGLILCACPNPPEKNCIISETLISPKMANMLTMNLIMPEGTQQLNGQLPSRSPDFAPNVTIDNPNILSSNGATTPIHINYNYAHKNLEGFYAQVEGSSLYFKVPFKNGPSGSHGKVQLPIGIPSNVDQGEFSILFCAVDIEGRVSNVAKAWFTVLRLGTGSVQVNLTWDNTTDLDLYVFDPMDEEIYSGRPSSQSGGILDRHDNDGFGPENISWFDQAPDGVYAVEVRDKTGNGDTSNFTVTICGCGNSRNFTGATVNGNKVTVISFTKDGDSIFF